MVPDGLVCSCELAWVAAVAHNPEGKARRHCTCACVPAHTEQKSETAVARRWPAFDSSICATDMLARQVNTM